MDCENSLLSENNVDNFLESNDTFHADLGNVTDTSPGSLESRDNVEMDQNSPIHILSEIRKKNLNRIVIGHLNINHLAGKFENLKLIIKDKLDILVLTESKTDGTFPAPQFIIEGFSPP